MVGVQAVQDIPDAPEGAGATVANASWKAPRRCAGPKCGVEFIPKRVRQLFAPDHLRCRRKHWELHHPRRGVKHPDKWSNRHAMWPTMRGLLAMLQCGPATVQQLWEVAGSGFSTCVFKLRAKGHKLEYDRGERLYRLVPK